jgi:hypothetical protein
MSPQTNIARKRLNSLNWRKQEMRLTKCVNSENGTELHCARRQRTMACRPYKAVHAPGVMASVRDVSCDASGGR